jgi:Na+/melibiose symporter-like transporter
LTFLILFLTPTYSSEILKAIHVAVIFALGCTAFTVINVPYSSMVAEMTGDYNERMSLTSFRMIFASIGALAAGALAMPLVDMGGGGAVGYRFMGIIYAAVMILTCLLCFWSTRNANVIIPKDQPIPFRQQIRIAFRNYPFLMLMLSYFFQAIAVGVMMAGFIYYIKYAMNLPETAMNLVYPLYLVTAVLFIPIWVKFGVKLGKIRAYKIGLVFYCLIMATIFFSRPSLLILFYIQVFLLGIGFSSFQLFPFSMLPDTIEYDQLQSGMRREGVFSGMWSSGQKIAYSLGPPIVGIALSTSGFVVGEAQPESVETGIRIVFCVLPTVVILLSFIPFFRYNLTKARFEEIKRALRSSGA